MNGQLTFEFPHRPASGRDDFIVVPGNRIAVDWIDRWPSWPGAGIVLHGPPGSGKTHLAHVFQERSGARFLTAAALATPALPELLGDSRAIILEGAETAPEAPLFHLHNLLAEQGGHLLLTAAGPPAHWPLRLADLRSRLVIFPSVALGLPDDDLLGAVLVKLFRDRQLAVKPDLLIFLLAHMERSVEAAREIVAALDAASLAERRAVTIPLARRLLARFPAEERL